MWLLDTKFNENPKLWSIPEHDLASSDEYPDSSDSESSADDPRTRTNYEALSWHWGTAGEEYDWSHSEDPIQDSEPGARVKYAILSHTWGHVDDEITFEQMRSGTYSRDSKGWFKIQQCRRQAATDGYDFVWVDTCCIDKSSSAELQEAINSMYYWYQRAAICYVYLADFDLNGKKFVAIQHEKCGDYKSREPQPAFKVSIIRASAVCDYYQITNQARPKLDNEFIASLWFTRGWTLQELLAPANITFFDSSWQRIGTKASMLCLLSEATGIPKQYLRARSRGIPSVAERFSWASHRQTTRIEDRAYSLLGIFGVNMPLLYGERHKAFIRLQEEIIKRSDDQSIFWWTRSSPSSGNDLGPIAPNLRCFSKSKGIVHLRSVPRLFSITNRGVSIEVTMAPWTVDTFIAFLNCGDDDENETPRTIFLRVIDDDRNNHYARVLVDGMHSAEENDDCKRLAYHLAFDQYSRTVHVLHRHNFRAQKIESTIYADRLNGFELGDHFIGCYEHLVRGKWSEKWQAVYSDPGNRSWEVAVLRVKIAGCRVKYIALGFETTVDRRSVPLVVFAETAASIRPPAVEVLDDSEDGTATDQQLTSNEQAIALNGLHRLTTVNASEIGYQPFKRSVAPRATTVNPSFTSTSERMWVVKIKQFPWAPNSDTGLEAAYLELKDGYEKGAQKTDFHIELTPFARGRSVDYQGEACAGGPFWRFSTSLGGVRNRSTKIPGWVA